MSLYGSIKEIQSNTEKLYSNLAKRFSENKLIHKLWDNMAHDVSLQIASLRELPKSFWTRLKKDLGELQKTIQTEVKSKSIDNTEDMTLSKSIESAIHSEEAIILKIYVPLIRNLRKNWSGQELDFYIMVKAHIVRIKRVAESFSGDPLVIQKAALLFQTFEKEVQEPEVDLSQILKPARKSRTTRRTTAPKAKPTGKTRPATKAKVQTKKSIPKGHSLVNRPQKRRSPSKPIATKAELRRRRAQR